jgi:hypothetical protein
MSPEQSAPLFPSPCKGEDQGEGPDTACFQHAIQDSVSSAIADQNPDSRAKNARCTRTLTFDPLPHRERGRPRSWRLSVRTIAQSFVDCMNHFVNTGEHLIVPEPQNSIAARLQKQTPSFIFLQKFSMLRAIQLNHQPPLSRTKIRKVRPNRMLPSELRAAHPPPSQMPPQYSFRVGLSSPQPARIRLRRFDDSHNMTLCQPRIKNKIRKEHISQSRAPFFPSPCKGEDQGEGPNPACFQHAIPDSGFSAIARQNSESRANIPAAPHFPSPCKGEDQGEGPYPARLARFRIPPPLLKPSLTRQLSL